MFYSRLIRIAIDVADSQGASHHDSRDRPENARNADVFGHNRKRPLGTMKTLAVICILALLTITGAAYSDQLLTREQAAAQRSN